MSRFLRMAGGAVIAVAALATPVLLAQVAVIATTDTPKSPTGVTIGPAGPAVAAPAPGQPPQPSPDAPQVYKLAATAAAEPEPPLRYRFSVPSTEREPGNSVPFYYRALVQFGNRAPETKAADDEKIGRWSESSIAELPLDEVRTLLGRYSFVFGELERAAVREQTDWDWRLEELGGVEAISFLLPEIQESRHLARLVKLKAQLEIAEGRFGDAAVTLRSGYSLAQAVAEPPTIINHLVGVAIASVMNSVVREWVAAPGSPNTYWAVASLPSPMFDLRPALEFELSLPYRFAPWLKDAETDVAPPEVWRDRIAKTLGGLEAVEPLLGSRAGQGRAADLSKQAVAAAIAVRSYPPAKRSLLGRGYDPVRVEAMPVGQVLAIQQKFVDDLIADELMKETFFPPAVAREVGEKSQQLLKQEGYLGSPLGQTAEPVPLMALLAPATRQAARSGWRLETFLAGLRTIEAIRMHAASTGAFPKSLGEIEVVPVPDDPMTGRPFAYTLEGDTAVLEIAPEPEQPRVNWRVEMTLKK